MTMSSGGGRRGPKRRDEVFYIGMFGRGGVGKTSVTEQYIFHRFNMVSYLEEIYRKTLEIDGETVKVEILDCAGLEQFTAMRQLYIEKSDGVVLMYDITNRVSFDIVDGLKNEIFQIKNDDSVPIVLCGNKCDLASDRQVSAEEGAALAESMGIPFFETSAKTATNVDELFSCLIRRSLFTGQTEGNNNCQGEEGVSMCAIC